MNLETQEQTGIAPINTDALLQDTYLKVIELRFSPGTSDRKSLREECISQVERARNALQDSGMSARNIDRIIHAQCALLDETVLATATDGMREKWSHESLQARFLGHHQAGERLYDEMRQVLHELAPDLGVLTVYQRVLMLGFLGCYRELDAEERMKLVNELNTHVPLIDVDRLPSLVRGPGPSPAYLHWLDSPVLGMVGSGLAVAVLWWILDRWLENTVASLAIGL
jgi:type VI secretion system protein ImpK